MRLLLLALPCTALLLPAPADACSDADGSAPPFEVRRHLVGVDTAAPTAPVIRSFALTRRRIPLAEDAIPVFTCGDGSGSEAAVTLRFDPAQDETAAVSEIGYRVEVVQGRAPRGLERGPSVSTFGSGGLRLAFDDRDDDEVIDFRMRLVPIDTAGNEGPPSETIHLYDEGVGCSAGAGGLSPLAFAALLGLRRRRTK